MWVRFIYLDPLCSRPREIDNNTSTVDMIELIITSTVSTFETRRRFDEGISVGELKGRLELLTGGNPGTMKLELFDKDNHFVKELRDNSVSLGSVGVGDGFRVHVEDSSRLTGEFEAELKEGEKFDLSHEEYKKKDDTVHAYLSKNKLGKYSEEFQQKRQEEEREESRKAEGLRVGDRCRVTVVGQPVKLGTVMFVGEVGFKPGAWVGIKYDEPLGKNDGCVGGRRYFECPPKYGGFVRPSCVDVGDFPEESLEDELDEI
ncbi:unnamed protein product [Cyprideis torosa]|uniref:Uncharacterized protein n=1 Tax=Cyprideis torosa TaxID=163714 RepID=A0A7R8WGM7_9CRUS|nr:unnamed protein product [Cyprideis torosa]CAG0892283.1 unnamed protein product [Cyprideis torosa]